MANEEHIRIEKQGLKSIEAWLVTHPHQRLDLRNGNLIETSLHRANLEGANLDDAILARASLQGASPVKVWPILLFD